MSHPPQQVYGAVHREFYPDPNSPAHLRDPLPGVEGTVTFYLIANKTLAAQGLNVKWTWDGIGKEIFNLFVLGAIRIGYWGETE
jgi:hypothetical protein